MNAMLEARIVAVSTQTLASVLDKASLHGTSDAADCITAASQGFRMLDMDALRREWGSEDCRGVPQPQAISFGNHGGFRQILKEERRRFIAEY
jgi:hypothetical protein